jgi:hypothetical protein
MPKKAASGLDNRIYVVKKKKIPRITKAWKKACQCPVVQTGDEHDLS